MRSLPDRFARTLRRSPGAPVGPSNRPGRSAGQAASPSPTLGKRHRMALGALAATGRAVEGSSEVRDVLTYELTKLCKPASTHLMRRRWPMSDQRTPSLDGLI